MKKDITDRSDVELLVNSFYEKVKANPVLGYIFDDVAKINWSSHLPKMYSFWSSILIDEHSYQGNPMLIHMQLSKLTSMGETQFNEWMNLFYETIDELFEGENADNAKKRAENIARLMLHKINSMDQPNRVGSLI
jgi:hemoglobin